MTDPQDPFQPYSYTYDPLGRSFDSPPEPPPVFLPPPPYRPTVNVFATLSVAFAFLCAPAGAIFGHLGLAQIRRTGELGRNRARLGLALSYGLITLAVVALVAWVTLGTDTSTQTATSPTPVAPPAPTVSPDAIAALLPGIADLKNLTAAQNLAAGRQWDHPARSDRDGAIDRTECWACIAPGTPDAYPVDAIAGYRSQEFVDTHSLFKSLQVIQAVVAFRDVPAARAQLAKLRAGWRQCGGTTVKVTMTGGRAIAFALNPPADAGNGITTMDLTPKDLQVRSVRAIAAKANIVVDLYLSSNGTTNADGPRQSVVSIANYILGKIPG